MTPPAPTPSIRSAGHEANHYAAPYAADEALGKLAAELRARGAAVHEPERDPGPRRVPVLRVAFDGRERQVWTSSLGTGFLTGHGVPVGAVTAPGEAAARLIDLLREPRTWA